MVTGELSGRQMSWVRNQGAVLPPFGLKLQTSANEADKPVSLGPRVAVYADSPSVGGGKSRDSDNAGQNSPPGHTRIPCPESGSSYREVGRSRFQAVDWHARNRQPVYDSRSGRYPHNSLGKTVVSASPGLLRSNKDRSFFDFPPRHRKPATTLHGGHDGCQLASA